MLITGCDTGFGHYLAIHLHEIGFQVFAGCLNDEGEGALRLKKANHGKNAIHVLKLDVTRDEDVELAKKYVFKNLKDTVLWGIVNNAGISVSAGFIESKPLDLFEKVNLLREEHKRTSFKVLQEGISSEPIRSGPRYESVSPLHQKKPGPNSERVVFDGSIRDAGRC